MLNFAKIDLNSLLAYFAELIETSPSDDGCLANHLVAKDDDFVASTVGVIGQRGNVHRRVILGRRVNR